ncbi:hypothetical protein [Myxococcus xanthus]|uniref:hypothetical protein n=1 Tax=Myxococcus xanthus TaxID=34 RepID=UPI00034C99BF|nr:hypothetical protein [Myxococcus xanthus]QVW70624.1 hypothetical protein JTM82_14190 [Myxococcus xanthus DZ2]QZZ49521.1 hypothetical protein MyxoNM_09930 [Myxococcus xanthus]UEO03249.1 hypothetical protein K1515_28625 [Myxococcus xanthus DZ2]UYI16593.1 hypothetical protein N3T43_09815 [Myxococcus xanthus]UYI23955.1 hypothetical protein N1129_09820 [Myxococcus xanthus]
MASNMWEQTAAMAKQHEQQGGAWLKLANDGDTAVVVFLGEPHPREVVFVDNKFVPFDEKLKAQGHRPSLRVALNVAVYDTREVKVVEQAVTFFNTLMELRAKYGLERWAFEVKRRGAAKDPKTTYSILPDRQLSPDEVSAFQSLRLHDLPKLYAAEEAAAASGTPPAATSSAKAAEPVDVKLAQAMATALKALPREAVDRFLQKFSVQRIRDLPASKGELARAFVDSLVAEYSAESVADVDPFGP